MFKVKHFIENNNNIIEMFCWNKTITEKLINIDHSEYFSLFSFLLFPPISIQNLPRTPKSILRKPCDYFKNTKIKIPFSILFFGFRCYSVLLEKASMIIHARQHLSERHNDHISHTTRSWQCGLCSGGYIQSSRDTPGSGREKKRL